MRWKWRFLSTSIVALSLTAATCSPETANGVNYGYINDVGGNRAACGRVYFQTGGSSGNFYVQGVGVTWMEPTASSVCRDSSETGERCWSQPGYLGNMGRMTESGVTCNSKPTGYNARTTVAFPMAVRCSNEWENEPYRLYVNHYWWSAVNNTYASVQQTSPITTL